MTTESNSCNPPLPSELENEDIEKIRGDAIGDTLYSERFVLKNLLKLAEIEGSLGDDETFEKDLCTLWDMTIEKDVVRLLLQHDVLELFASIIQKTEDVRMLEILIGIVGNMCNLSETRRFLCLNENEFMPILSMIECRDTPTLIQLMRLLHTALVFENSGDETIWFQHFQAATNFVQQFADILTNSTSRTLLLHAYEALNAICTKFAILEFQPETAEKSFRELFVVPELVQSVLEAFKQMLPNQQETEMTKATQRIAHLFLDINVVLSQYDSTSLTSYAPIQDDLFDCIAQILKPLSNPIHLFPLTSNEQGIIENVNELFQCLDSPFHPGCFQQLMVIWAEINARYNQPDTDEKGENSEWNLADNDEDINANDIEMSLLEFLTRTSRLLDDNTLEESLRPVDTELIIRLNKFLLVGDSETDIKKFSDKLRTIIKKRKSDTT